VSKRFGVSAVVALALALGAPLAMAQHGAPPSSEEGHAATHEHTDEHGGAHGPGAINWTEFGGTRTDGHGETQPNPPPFVASLFNFLLLLGILFWAVTRKVNPALSDRRTAIQAEMDEAKRLRTEAEEMHREYSERLGRMESEFAALRAEFIQAGETESARIIAEAKTRAERMQRDGELTIQQEIRQLRSDLLREAVEAASSSAEQTVRSSINAGDQGRLADDYLAHLEKDAMKGARA
jgi:F-type H+-transporting ATPase subunit b